MKNKISIDIIHLINCILIQFAEYMLNVFNPWVRVPYVFLNYDESREFLFLKTIKIPTKGKATSQGINIIDTIDAVNSPENVNVTYKFF